MSARARAALGAVSLVIVGAVLGIAIDRHLLPQSHGHDNTAAAFHQVSMASLHERLDLTDEQRASIEAIIARRHSSLAAAWQVLHEQLGATVDSVHQEIEAVLTPEQRSEFREWLRDFRPDG